MIALEGGPVHVWKEVKILCVQGGVKGVKEAWGEGINRKRMRAIKGVIILMKIKEQKGGFFFPTPFNGKNIALWGSGSQLGCERDRASSPWGHLALSGDIFVKIVLLLASSGYRPEILLNILQCM